MKKVFLAGMLMALLSGCTAPLGYVKFSVTCEAQRGQLGNNCQITVPDDSEVHIDGENISVKYDRVFK